MTTKTVYICHPYANDPEGNIKSVIEICRDIKHHVVPLAPHLALKGYIDEATERSLALKHGLKLLEGCDELWVCSEQISEGMVGEIRQANKLGIPVISYEEEMGFREEERKRREVERLMSFANHFPGVRSLGQHSGGFIQNVQGNH
jgi:hypothetical protein